MRSIVTPTEMRAIDAAAPESVGVLIERAGWATAGAVRRLMGSVSGRRIVVLAGPGNNGADGLVAGRVLARWGALVHEVAAQGWSDAPASVWQRADLVLDAAYGTGLREGFDAPDLERLCGPPRPKVVAVDIPSGVDGLTGSARGTVLAADVTITFGALKPGLLMGDGARLAGTVAVADLGLDCSGVRAHLLEESDLHRWPTRPANSHKWHSAVWVIGGSPGMPGAPRLAASGAARSGAGYVLVSTPDADRIVDSMPTETVTRLLSGSWAASVVDQADRVAAMVIGPGLPTDDHTGKQVRSVVGSATMPVVLDGGALDAVAADPSCLTARSMPAVLTPHDGEYARLMGSSPGTDRLDAARRAARRYRSVVVLKGPTTVVAHPDGDVLVSNAGDARLATAGTGDVLSGIIGAGLARGLEPLWAAGLGAELHGNASRRGHVVGLIAGDIPPLIADLLSSQRLESTPSGEST